MKDPELIKDAGLVIVPEVPIIRRHKLFKKALEVLIFKYQELQRGWSGFSANSQGTGAPRGGKGVTDVSAGSYDTISNTYDVERCAPSPSFNAPSYGSFKEVLGEDKRASQVVVDRYTERAHNSYSDQIESDTFTSL
jgi:hypothetical protein